MEKSCDPIEGGRGEHRGGGSGAKLIEIFHKTGQKVATRAEGGRRCFDRSRGKIYVLSAAKWPADRPIDSPLQAGDQLLEPAADGHFGRRL